MPRLHVLVRRTNRYLSLIDGRIKGIGTGLKRSGKIIGEYIYRRRVRRREVFKRTYLTRGRDALIP
jgi:hypothetical protein